MKQIYEFAGCIFFENIPRELKRHIHTICQDANGALFIKAQGVREKRKNILTDTIEKDPIRFKVKNGLFDENCKIYLN